MEVKARTYKLEGLSEKIFLDRYAKKDLNPDHIQPGDTVLVLTKDDRRFPQKEVGEVLERDGSGFGSGCGTSVRWKRMLRRRSSRWS